MKGIEEDKIVEILNSTEIDIDWVYYLDFDNIDLEEDLSEQIKDQLTNSVECFDVDIIYYSNAMEYLSRNDASLQASMELASGMGYEVANLNSELLASLLASQNLRDKFNGSFPEIELKSLQEEFRKGEEDEDWDWER